MSVLSIADRVRLLITDGCQEEYLAFIKNTGERKSFPFAVLGLCYYHLCCIGYETHVKKYLSTDTERKIGNDIVMGFVKQWGFDIETEDEFKVSKTIFFIG